LLHCLGSFALHNSGVKHGSCLTRGWETHLHCWFYLGSSRELYPKHRAKRYDNFWWCR
jgi:hypothetical protein